MKASRNNLGCLYHAQGRRLNALSEETTSGYNNNDYERLTLEDEIGELNDWQITHIHRCHGLSLAELRDQEGVTCYLIDDEGARKFTTLQQIEMFIQQSDLEKLIHWQGHYCSGSVNNFSQGAVIFYEDKHAFLPPLAGVMNGAFPLVTVSQLRQYPQELKKNIYEQRYRVAVEMTREKLSYLSKYLSLGNSGPWLQQKSKLLSDYIDKYRQQSSGKIISELGKLEEDVNNVYRATISLEDFFTEETSP